MNKYILEDCRCQIEAALPEKKELDVEIVETDSLDNIIELAEYFDMKVHELSEIVKAWEAQKGGEFIGGIALEKNGCYELDFVEVKEEYQRKYVGTKLAKTLFNEVSKRGGKNIYLKTRYAKGFHKKMGFTDVDLKEYPNKINVCSTCKRYPEECNPFFMRHVINQQ